MSADVEELGRPAGEEEEGAGAAVRMRRVGMTSMMPRCATSADVVWDGAHVIMADANNTMRTCDVMLR